MSPLGRVSRFYAISWQLLTGLCLLGAFSGHCASAVPSLQAFPLNEAPELDGQVMEDAAWKGAQPATGFWQTRPDEGQPASEETVVFLGYTADALYIAAVLFDASPEQIIVSDSRRDADLDETDSFRVIIDGFLDKKNGFVFGTNPAGIQHDGQVANEGRGGVGTGFSSGGFNKDWDTNWEVATNVGGHGWSVEMEIPFKSLRYPKNTEHTWGINFQRNIRRNNEKAFWSKLPRQHNLYRVSEAGTVEGVRTPPQRNLKIIPYVLGKSVEDNQFPGGGEDSEIGIDIKYSITPSLTLDATYNTDFAQAEVDKVVVNLNRFDVFLPEKRLFFLENAGQFSVGQPEEVELFFSRRIGLADDGTVIPIEGGLRLSGKLGNRTNVGLLHMRTEAVDGVVPANDFSVMRINQELASRSSLGAIYIERDGKGGPTAENYDDYNRTYGIDGRWGIGDNVLLTAYAAKTDTPGLDGKDHAFSLRGEYNSEQWLNFVHYAEVGDTFNPEVGFLTRRNYRKGEFLILNRYRPDNLWGLQEIRPHMSYKGWWSFDGHHQSGVWHIDSHFEYKSGLEFHTGVNFIHEGVLEPFDIIEGETVTPDDYNSEEFQWVFFTNQGAPLSFQLDGRVGGFFGGDKVTLQPTIKRRIGEKFNSELSWNYNRIDLDTGNGAFDINVGILRLAYSFTPKMSLETIVQYDDRTDSLATNIRFAWLQAANTGLYLVYNEVDEDRLAIKRNRREFIVKFNHIFDIL